MVINHLGYSFHDCIEPGAPTVSQGIHLLTLWNRRSFYIRDPRDIAALCALVNDKGRTAERSKVHPPGYAIIQCG